MINAFGREVRRIYTILFLPLKFMDFENAGKN
jgi:hypothetical protein